jgi:hypothetical protein
MRTLKYGDPETVLRGQIYTDYFFGRPGYGETPELDELEHSILLALDEPFAIPSRDPRYEGDYEAAGCNVASRRAGAAVRALPIEERSLRVRAVRAL